MVNAENENKNIQLTCILSWKLLKKPMMEFMDIISKEVPTALFIGSRPIKNKIGIIKNPPPAPTNPVIIPTTKPDRIKTKRLFVSSHC